MTIAEWVGLLGVLPFVALLAMTGVECVESLRVDEPNRRPTPLLDSAGHGGVGRLVHASFEDWLFAVGSYLCVFFWVFAFLLADLVPGAVVVPVAGVASRVSRPSPAGFGAVVPNR